MCRAATDWLEASYPPEVSFRAQGYRRDTCDEWYLHLLLKQRRTPCSLKIEILCFDGFQWCLCVVPTNQQVAESVHKCAFEPRVIVVDPHRRAIARLFLGKQRKLVSCLRGYRFERYSRRPVVLSLSGLMLWASTALSNKEPATGKRLLQLVVDFSPKYGQHVKQQALIKLGAIYIDEGNYSKAASMLEQALSMPAHVVERECVLNQARRLPGPYAGIDLRNPTSEEHHCSAFADTERRVD